MAQSHQSFMSMFEEGIYNLKLVIRLLEISPINGVIMFGKNGTLCLGYVIPYQILKRIKKLSDELDIQNELVFVNLVFHVSMIKKYIGDVVSITPFMVLGVAWSLS